MELLETIEVLLTYEPVISMKEVNSHLRQALTQKPYISEEIVRYV